MTAGCMLGVFAREAGFSFFNVAVGACPAVKYGVDRVATSRRVADCNSSLPHVWSAAEEYDVVILGSFWTGYYPRIPDFFDYLAATVRDLLQRDIEVIILGMPPIIHGYDRRCREKSVSFPLMECPMNPVELDGDVIRVNLELREFAASIPGVEYFDANEYLCPNRLCDVRGDDGLSRYFDAYHMSVPESWNLGRRIVASDGVPPVFELGNR